MLGLTGEGFFYLEAPVQLKEFYSVRRCMCRFGSSVRFPAASSGNFFKILSNHSGVLMFKKDLPTSLRCASASLETNLTLT